MFPFGQPNPLGWPGGVQQGAAHDLTAQANPTAISGPGGLPVMTGAQLAVLQAATSLPGSLVGSPAGFSLPQLSQLGLFGAAPGAPPNTPGLSTLSNGASQQSLSGLAMTMPASSQQQQHQQQHQLALAAAAAAALMSQLQYPAAAPTRIAQADALNNPGMSPWALLLAQQAGMLQQQASGSGMRGLYLPTAAQLLPLDMMGARGTAELVEQSHPSVTYLQQGQLSSGCAPAVTAQQHQLQEASAALPDGSESQPDSSSSPASDPVSQEQSQRSVRAAPRQQPRPAGSNHSQQQQGAAGESFGTRAVVDSALMEHSQRGSSEELSAASGCSQPPPPPPAQQAPAPAGTDDNRHPVKDGGQQQWQEADEQERLRHQPLRRNSGSMRSGGRQAAGPAWQPQQPPPALPAPACAGLMQRGPGAQMPPPPRRLVGNTLAGGSCGPLVGMECGALDMAVAQELPVGLVAAGTGGLQDQMRDALGPQQWGCVRATLLRQQATFVQQLYELHKLNSIQKLLCMELDVYDPAQSAGGPGGPSGPGPGAGGHWGHTTSTLSLPSVCAPPQRNGRQPGDSGYNAGGGGGVEAAGADVPRGMLQRVQQDLDRLANIPPLLRSKAKTSSPDHSLLLRGPAAKPVAALAVGPATTAAEAGDMPKAARVVKPVPVRRQPAIEFDHTTVIQRGAGQLPPPAPSVAAAVPGTLPPDSLPAVGMAHPAGSGPGPVHGAAGGLLEAATALLHSSGGLMPARPMPGLLGVGPRPAPSRPAASSGKQGAASAMHMGSSIGSPGAAAVAVPAVAPPPLLAGAAGTLACLPPAPAPLNGLKAAVSAPLLDPHAAWFSKHYSNPMSAPTAAGAGRQDNSMGGGIAGASAAAGVDEAAAAGNGSEASAKGLPAGAGVDPASAAAPVVPVRWWQDEAAVFGEVAPSMLHATSNASGMKPQVTSGSKRNAKQSGQQAGGSSGKKSRGNEPAGDHAAGGSADARNPRAPSAFKAVRPRKARSKHGSNRLGPSGTRDSSVMSDDSNSSMNQQEGSVVMGMSCAAAPSVPLVSASNRHVGALAGSPSPTNPAAGAPNRPSGRVNGPANPPPAYNNGGSRRKSGGGNGDGNNGGALQAAPARAAGGSAQPAAVAAAVVVGGGDGHVGACSLGGGSGQGHVSGPTHPLDSSHGSEEKERSAAKLLLSLSCGGSVGHGSLLPGMHLHHQQAAVSQQQLHQHGLMAHDGLGGSDGTGQAMSVSA